VQAAPEGKRPHGLLDELLQLLANPAPEREEPSLAVRLAAWREEMERIDPGLLAGLPVEEREDLARRARLAQARVADCLREREKARRALLIRALSYRAVQNALNSYRPRAVRGFFTRTV